MPIKTTIERIKVLLSGWRERLNKKEAATILAVIIILYGLIFFPAYIRKIKIEQELVPLPSLSPTPAEEEIITPSSYATDSAVLAIEEDLEILEKDLLETDLYETGLNPPVLDMDVSFKER